MVFLATESEFLLLFIHDDIRASGYTAGTHTTCYDSCMRGHAATYGKYTLCSLHTLDILRAGLKTNENDLLASGSPILRILRSKYDLTAGSAGSGTKCLAHDTCACNSIRIKLGMKQCIKVTGIDHRYGFFLGPHAFVYKIACDLQSGLSGPLAVTCLEHEQLAVFYGKLHILHVTIMFLEDLANILELLKSLRELLCHLGYLHRCTNTGNNVLALCIGKELTEQTLLACCGVTCKCNAGSAVIAHISERHALYVNSGTPRIRDIVVTTVNIGSGVIP